MGRGVWSRFGFRALGSLGTVLVPIEVDIGQRYIDQDILLFNPVLATVAPLVQTRTGSDA